MAQAVSEHQKTKPGLRPFNKPSQYFPIIFQSVFTIKLNVIPNWIICVIMPTSHNYIDLMVVWFVALPQVIRHLLGGSSNLVATNPA